MEEERAGSSRLQHYAHDDFEYGIYRTEHGTAFVLCFFPLNKKGPSLCFFHGRIADLFTVE